MLFQFLEKNFWLLYKLWNKYISWTPWKSLWAKWQGMDSKKGLDLKIFRQCLYSVYIPFKVLGWVFKRHFSEPRFINVKILKCRHMQQIVTVEKRISSLKYLWLVRSSVFSNWNANMYICVLSVIRRVWKMKAWRCLLRRNYNFFVNSTV